MSESFITINAIKKERKFDPEFPRKIWPFLLKIIKKNIGIKIYNKKKL